MSELKPCVMPGCGSQNVKLKTISDGAIYEKNDIYYIVCNDCALSTHATYDLESLIDQWNTRQPHPAIKAVYEKWKNYEMSRPDEYLDHMNDEIWQAIRKAVEDG